MVKKIVFFCFGPVIKYHYKRFGVEILKQNGFEVWFYDFSPIVSPAICKGAVYIDKPTSEDYFQFFEEKKAIQAIHELGDECFVVVTGHYQTETFKIFRALSRANIPYAVWSVSVDATGMGGQGESSLWKFFLKFKRFNLKKLKRLLYKPILAPVFGIRSPDACMLSGEKSLEFNGPVARIGEKTELIWAHTPDYDTYLTDLHKKEAEENIALWIEPSGPMFPWDDFLPRNTSPVWTVEQYYPSLCRFFDYVEKELGLKVIIAAHPKSNHADDRPEYFGKRQAIPNQILPLIKKSRFVMSHNSTALSFAVLEKKPILCLTTAEFETDIAVSRMFKVVASSLGTTPINVDAAPYSIDWKKKLLVNEDLYLSYQQQYLKKAGSEKLNSWQILANHLKQSSY